jgi:hypothetical protein
MVTLVAQLAPQRSTQYANLVSLLAPHEITLSPFGRQISDLEPIRLGGQAYLCFVAPELPDEKQTRELGSLALSSAFFQYYEDLAGLPGPFLRPLETHYETALPSELLVTRRYRGKTNELFTLFMCNVARFSSRYASQPWSTLRILDPLAGGGTTLLAGLILGADVAGVEKDLGDVESTATFIDQFLREQGIKRELREERLRKLGHKWSFTIGARVVQRCFLAHGDTGLSKELMAGFRPHLIVTDLPYGIQHQGVLADLLGAALPVWVSMLEDGGVLTFSWDATRFPRSEMVALVESISPLSVLKEPPYDRLAHRVDRVIKQRDVLVARLDR